MLRKGTKYGSAPCTLPSLYIGVADILLLNIPVIAKHGCSAVQSNLLRAHTHAYFVPVDWCMYRGWGDPPNRKSTRLLTAAPWLCRTTLKTCNKQHDHGHPLRGSRAAAATAYPKSFCNAVALLWDGAVALFGPFLSLSGKSS